MHQSNAERHAIRCLINSPLRPTRFFAIYCPATVRYFFRFESVSYYSNGTTDTCINSWSSCKAQLATLSETSLAVEDYVGPSARPRSRCSPLAECTVGSRVVASFSRCQARWL